MRKDIRVVGEPRPARGKNESRRLRVSGRIPAVIYGADKNATAVSLDPKEINQILFSGMGHNTIISFELAGEETVPAMIVDLQHDPVKEDLLHVDLKRIDRTKKISVKVPVHTEGEPVGVKTQDGLLEIVHREVEIECFPDDIPDRIVADVRELKIGDTIRAQDLPLGDRITLQGKKTMVICHVVETRVSTDAEEAEEEVGIVGAETEAAEEKPE